MANFSKFCTEFFATAKELSKTALGLKGLSAMLAFFATTFFLAREDPPPTTVLAEIAREVSRLSVMFAFLAFLLLLMWPRGRARVGGKKAPIGPATRSSVGTVTKAVDASQEVADKSRHAYSHPTVLVWLYPITIINAGALGAPVQVATSKSILQPSVGSVSCPNLASLPEGTVVESISVEGGLLRFPLGTQSLPSAGCGTK